MLVISMLVMPISAAFSATSPSAPVAPAHVGSMRRDKSNTQNDTTTPSTDPGQNQTSPATNLQAQPDTSSSSGQEVAQPSADSSPQQQDPQATSADQTAVSAGNENTGADSTNNAGVNSGGGPLNSPLLGSSANISTDNKAKVNNDLVLSADSGNNNADYNTGNGNVKTGDADIVLTILNLINTTFVTMPDGNIAFLFKNIYGDQNGNIIFDPKTGESYDLNGARVSADNSNTGANSNNSAIINSNESTTIKNNNDATVGNNFDLKANTGNNSASYNTGNGNIKTGDANVSLNLMNLVNSSFMAAKSGLVGVINIFGNWIGDLLLPKNLIGQGGQVSGANVSAANSSTGSNSTNDATTAINNALDINNDNNADLTNKVNVSNNTGGNDGSYNTGNGGVASGQTMTKLNLSNLVNQNYIGDFVLVTFINVMGKWIGANLLQPLASSASSNSSLSSSNTKTGADSTNSASINAGNDTSISSTNDGNIGNNINIFTNTGGNKSDYNTGNGQVQSGNSNVMANLMNMMNINVVSNHFIFLVVNVFGDWLGNINAEGNEPKKVSVLSSDQNQNMKDNSSAIQTNISKNFNNLLNVSGSGQNVSTTEPDSNVTVLAPGSTVKSAKITNADQSYINPVINFIKANFMTILGLLLIVYLSFLSVYFGRRKNLKSK